MIKHESPASVPESPPEAFSPGIIPAVIAPIDLPQTDAKVSALHRRSTNQVPSTKPRKRQHKASAGRILATGLSTSGLFGGVAAFASQPKPAWESAPQTVDTENAAQVLAEGSAQAIPSLATATQAQGSPAFATPTTEVPNPLTTATGELEWAAPVSALPDKTIGDVSAPVPAATNPLARLEPMPTTATIVALPRAQPTSTQVVAPAVLVLPVSATPVPVVAKVLPAKVILKQVARTRYFDAWGREVDPAVVATKQYIPISANEKKRLISGAGSVTVERAPNPNSGGIASSSQSLALVAGSTNPGTTGAQNSAALATGQQLLAASGSGAVPTEGEVASPGVATPVAQVQEVTTIPSRVAKIAATIPPPPPPPPPPPTTIAVYIAPIEVQLTVPPATNPPVLVVAAPVVAPVIAAPVAAPVTNPPITAAPPVAPPVTAAPAKVAPAPTPPPVVATPKPPACTGSKC
jgi:hypothetical protein